MTKASPPPLTPAIASAIPLSLRIFLAVILLLFVAWLDIFVPFQKPWSNLYLLVALYVGMFLPGRIEVFFYCALIACTLMVPSVFRPDNTHIVTSLLNRVSGVVAGLLMVALIWSRRDYITALRSSNEELEAKVVARTSELQLANRMLQSEVAERERIQIDLESSRERLQALSRQLITTQETERRHIARELHDEIGQILTAIKMNLRRARAAADPDVQLILDENFQMVDQAIEQTRSLSLSLRPPQLDELGLVAALHWLIGLQGRSGEFEGRLDVDLSDAVISPELEMACFRIVQEALTNAVRHARPRLLQVKLWAENQQLHLTVRDDGVGFNVDEQRQHARQGDSIGLISMQERASLMGGHFDIQSSPNQGTTISACFPLAT